MLVAVVGSTRTFRYQTNMKIILIFFTFVLTIQTVFSQKIEVKELISKHLASITGPERKAKLANVTAVGEAEFIQGVNHQRLATGKSVFVSDGKRVAMAMTFPLDNYPVDRVTFDSKKLSIPFIRPGIRSPFGDYLMRNEEIVKEGLFGGALSTGWMFHYPDEKKGSLSLEGKKKVDGREAYVVSYSPKAGSGLNVRIFFDSETGRHVRTEYRRVISAQMGPTPELSARQNETIEEMSEDFADFKTENGVTLPRSYKVRLASIRGGNTREFFYTLSFGTFYYDQQLDASTFDVEAK